MFTDLSAKEIIVQFSRRQRGGHFSCPRCGKNNMADDPIHNALSRRADCYVCDACGTDEAIRAFLGNTLPLSEWSIIKNVYDFLNECDT